MEEKLFGDIGGKLKSVAFWVCILGFAASVLFVIASWFVLADSWKSEFGEYLLALILGGLGCLISWLSTLVLYGLGQLVENSDIVASKMEQIGMNPNNVSAAVPKPTITPTQGASYGPWKNPNA